jgi:hypothetical protein
MSPPTSAASGLVAVSSAGFFAGEPGIDHEVLYLRQID